MRVRLHVDVAQGENSQVQVVGVLNSFAIHQWHQFEYRQQEQRCHKPDVYQVIQE